MGMLWNGLGFHRACACGIFFLTLRTIMVISRSTSSPSFRRAGQGTGHAAALPKTGHPHMVGVDWGGFADMSRAHRSNQRIPVRQGYWSGNGPFREQSRPLALSGPFDTAVRPGADRMKGDRELGGCGSPGLNSQSNRRKPPLKRFRADQSLMPFTRFYLPAKIGFRAEPSRPPY